MKVLIMQFSPTSVNSSLLGPDIFLNTLSHIPSVYVLTLMLQTKFHTHTEPEAKL
jgi:hypothetical protein